LLLNLSDNYLRQAQFNAVVPSQKEMDRVGVEPTTSAFCVKAALYLLSRRDSFGRRTYCSNPTRSTVSLHAL
jgi:hypothetical protein